MATRRRPTTGLAAEIRQTKPFSAPEVEAYLNLLRSAELFSDEVSVLCKSEGISQSQYNVLRILRGAGPGGLTCGEVSERVISRLPDISRLLDRMKVARLLHKKQAKEDRRVFRVIIAARGLRILERLDEPLLQLHLRQFASMQRAELEQLNRLLEKARSRVGDGPKGSE